MRDKTVAIIDSGGANIASLRNALDRLGANHVITSNAARIRSASHVILPGVGAAADAMNRIRTRKLAGLIPSLSQPVLGICLGMQLLADGSEEDDADCLGIVPGNSRRLNSSPGNPVPNMGWCRVHHDSSHDLFDGIADGSYFYFLHSFALDVADYSLGTAMHDTTFTAALRQDNFVATQFHPEKSSTNGARLLANFLRM